MTETTRERPLGLLEKYQISKQITKAYGNVVLAAQLEHDDSITDPHKVFQPALTRLLQIHPSLSIIVRDANNSNAHFERLTNVDVAALIQSVPSNSVDLQELIRQETSNEFDTDSYLPLWRLTVMPTSESTCAVVFAAHHVICDGMSLSIFWQDFLKELNNPNSVPESTTTRLAAPYELCNPPDISLVWDVVPVLFKNFAPKFLPTFMVNYVDPLKYNAWQGDHPAIDGEAHNTQVRLIHVPEDIWKPLLDKSKSLKISAHAVVYMASVQAWTQLYPDEMTEVGTPMNCRTLCNPPVSARQIGNYVGNYASIWSATDLKGKGFWDLAREYHDDLQKNKVTAAKQSLFLKFLPEYPASYCDFWHDKRKNSNMGRSGGFEVSDLGRFATTTNETEWKVHDVYFCQSAQVFTNAFHVNSVSCHNSLYCTLSWQKGALDEAKMNKFHDVFIHILKQV